MGKRLAEEVDENIRELNKIPSKISFIGHSMGGLIIRAALPHLEFYSKYMYSLMTFSTPHLGTRQGSKLTSFGLKIMKKW